MENEKSYVGAPYNFVPFSPKVLERYAEASEIPSPCTIAPELLSGEISLKLTAETPLFISNGRQKEHADFFRGADGTYQIPGSSLRGLLRTNMQILGFGLLREEDDFADSRMTYRLMALGTGRNQLGRGDTNRDLAAEYKAAIEDQNVKPCFVHCLSATRYQLLPVKKYFVVKRKKTAKLRRAYYIIDQHTEAKDVQQWREKSEFFAPCWYQDNGEQITALSAEECEGWKQGVIMAPGQMNRQNSLYVFPLPENNSDAIELPNDDRISYEEEYRRKGNVLRGHSHKLEHWELPKQDMPDKPMFYVRNNGHYSLSVSRYPRILYRGSIADGLYESWKRRQNKLIWDYANAVMGAIDRSGSETRRSRLRIGALYAAQNAKPMPPRTVVLGEPKPSSYLDYLTGGSYNDDFKLRGFKQYWLHEMQLPSPSGKEKAESILRPMPTSTVFTGKIRYCNLYPDELGLLLWCILLEDDCHQTIGMGKPYGLGRCKIEITALKEDKPELLYHAASWKQQPDSAKDVGERVEAYVAACKKELKERLKLKREVMDESNIQDFFALKRTICQCDEVRYMTLEEYTSTRSNKLQTVADYRVIERERSTDGNETDMWEKLLSMNSKVTAGNKTGKKRR